MANLEEVVRERNRAYYELETGETGERPGRVVDNELGMRFFYKEFEHMIPRFMNKRWRESHKFSYGGFAVRNFMLKYRERLYNVKRKSRNRDRNEVMHLMKRNPDMDRNFLATKYPHVDIDKLVRDDKIRGHYAPKI